MDTVEVRIDLVWMCRMRGRGIDDCADEKSIKSKTTIAEEGEVDVTIRVNKKKQKNKKTEGK